LIFLRLRSASSLLHTGTYFAEDAGKNDQYVTRDARYGSNSKLHEQLYGKSCRHPNQPVFYLLLCRVSLGCFVTTVDGLKDSAGNSVFASDQKRELATVPGASPPVHYHSLVAELGGSIQRYREFISFRSEYTYPEYLLAYRRR
jgi:hypothetical protein